MIRVLITGANGFVGRTVVDSLLASNYSVKAAVRNRVNSLPESVIQIEIGDLSETTDWADTFVDIDIVIHTAARVHIMDDDVADPLKEFRKVNVQATHDLASKAAADGVKRFIFLSSIKVNGESTKLNHPFKASDELFPTDPYGLSKYEAEKALLEIAKNSEMEVVIIRPPLVYGPGVKANFASMLKFMNKELPLPLGAIYNKRSFIALENLVSLITHCTCIEKTPRAANQIFLISDDEDVSTSELLKKVAKALGKKAWLIPIPVSIMSFLAKIIGKSDVANRLFSSLQADSSKARELLSWKPIITMDEQLKKTADAYLSEKNL